MPLRPITKKTSCLHPLCRLAPSISACCRRLPSRSLETPSFQRFSLGLPTSLRPRMGPQSSVTPLCDSLESSSASILTHWRSQSSGNGGDMNHEGTSGGLGLLPKTKTWRFSPTSFSEVPSFPLRIHHFHGPQMPHPGNRRPTSNSGGSRFAQGLFGGSSSG